jgi:next-to-BRCA1 protein 1
MATNMPVTLETLIVVKLQFQGHNRKFKLPLRDLGAHVLPEKLRAALQVLPDDEVIFERYSDSAGAYVTLDSDKPQVYKTLFRAAKAKLKLRLRASLVGQEPEPAPVAPLITVQETAPSSYGSSLHRPSSDTLTPQRAAPAIVRSPSPPPQLVQQAPLSPVSPLMPTKADADAEAPVPHPFLAREQFFAGLATHPNADLAFRPKQAPPQCSWVVFCNHCNQPMEDEHFHCSICDHGDYDLCPSCVNAGIHCPGSGHWMVKRFVKDGCVVNSTTERVGPKTKPPTDPTGKEMPGAFTEEKQPIVYEAEEPTRTCNNCVKVLSEKEFVTCTKCDDFDLCVDCHVNNKHGHHPAHAFKPATPDTKLTALADILCNAGRNVRHSAVCDGCEKFIYGVRHKCLNCPDWDFCADCVKSAKYVHPGHRFVPIYEPLAEPVLTGNRHYGIYCDGPLCKDKENQSYIEGIRYKCAVCHDTDFCANCEASPSNRHNHTHPLIKFKRPVRSVSVTTIGEDKNGVPIPRLGDQPARKSTATETNPVAPSTNAATQVQTVVDLKPSQEPQQKTKEKIEIRDLLVEPVQEKISVHDLLSSPAVPAPEVKDVKYENILTPASDELDAHFVRDTITDGTKVFAGLPFVQVWTLRNPGPKAWPAGCSVRHVGGDNMLNLDNTRPLSQSELAEASESNVMGRPVEQGEEISFRVVMKAPIREGTAISYWRLKAADGTPFGHRLWCDIQVISPPSPATSSPPQPAAVPATSSETSETPNLTPYERFQQAKNFRAMQRAMVTPLEQKKEAMERQSRMQEEALERLRRMKLRTDDKEYETRMTNNLEQEKMARIQKVRRATVERLLENRRKEFEASLATAKPKIVEPFVKQETVELPVEEKSALPQAQASGMIFPQLDKESPASSTHEALSAKSEPLDEVKTETAAETKTMTAPSEHSEDDFFEDAESVEVRSFSSDDEGFMTDEEYDILDASDEELP